MPELNKYIIMYNIVILFIYIYMVRNMGKNKRKEKRRLLESKFKFGYFIYYIFGPILIAVAKLSNRCRSDKSALKGHKAPYLVLGNHATVVDFMFFCNAVFPRKMTFVAAEKLQYEKPFYAWALKKGRIIFKKQFYSDYNAVKNMKKALDSGISVMMFPEGKTTLDGRNNPIAQGLGKLVKWLGYPVVVGITTGAYASRPVWCERHDKKRKARITVKYDVVLSRDDLKTLSADQIEKLIADKMAYNENDNFYDTGVEIKCERPAEGLQEVLYQCPDCRKELVTDTMGDVIYCTECGNAARFTPRMRLEPAPRVKKVNGVLSVLDGAPQSKVFARIDDWNGFQRENVKTEVKPAHYKWVAKVVVKVPDSELCGFRPVGDGEFTLTHAGLVYDGKTREGEIAHEHMEFSLKRMQTAPFSSANGIDIYYEGVAYTFDFTEKPYAKKFMLAIEELHKMSVN